MKFIGVDIETTGLKPHNGTIWMLSITKNGKTIVKHDCNGKTQYFKEYANELEDEDICKVGHNIGEFDAPYIELNTGIRLRNLWDTMLCETVIQGTQIPLGSKDEQLLKQHSPALKHVLPRYGFPSPDKTRRENFIDRPKGIPFEKADIQYGGDDTRYLLQLQKAQEFLLQRDGGLEVALLENKVTEVVAQMKVNGLGVDIKLWDKIADANLRTYHNLLAKLPRGINWNSPAQAKNYFYSRGILIQSLTEIESIAVKVNDPDLNTFVKARDLYSDTTAYGKKWLRDKEGNLVVDADNRIRTQWQQIINTGRFATSKPNILALPKEGNQRAAIIPKPGYVFVIGDYTGQEMGIMAAAAKEDFLIDALLRGDSTHGLVAIQLFPDEWNHYKEKGCTFPKKCKCKGHQDITGFPYFKAKKLNFMLAYGGGPQKFAQITGCAENLAKAIVYRHKRVIKNITRYLERNGKEAVRTGIAYSADPYKRRIILKGQEEWQVRNQGKNYPIQSAGANMLKLSMISIPEQYPIVLPFHDELVLEVRARDAERAVKAQRDVMNQSADYITGIAGLIRVQPRTANNFLKK